jgi:hypothetical protein
MALAKSKKVKMSNDYNSYSDKIRIILILLL